MQTVQYRFPHSPSTVQKKNGTRGQVIWKEEKKPKFQGPANKMYKMALRICSWKAYIHNPYYKISKNAR